MELLRTRKEISRNYSPNTAGGGPGITVGPLNRDSVPSGVYELATVVDEVAAGDWDDVDEEGVIVEITLEVMLFDELARLAGWTAE